jgi:hypothetical protein
MPDHSDETTRAAPMLDVRRAAIHRAPLSDDHDANLHWEALLDARLIGTKLPTPPDVTRQREETDTLFRRIAADRRAAGRANAWGRSAWGNTTGGFGA